MSKERDDTPDEVLVVAAILGDLEAFNELAGRYRAAAVRAAQSIVGVDYAEDVAQDALLLAFKALPSIEQPSKFAPWLGAITRNRALRFNKREVELDRRRVEFDEALLAEIDALARPFLVEGEANEELRLALEKIADDYAMVLRMHFLDEMPLKRIAAFLGVPLSTVKWRVHKGKQLLREQVELLGKSEVKSGKRTGDSQAGQRA
ncbi:MAG TPA: RNA polymerase sigma factor [Pyrinomonadaceae bacterium]|nr:RNA polymerase sigma factor [Pyrinomonadaceae bacterium]